MQRQRRSLRSRSVDAVHQHTSRHFTSVPRRQSMSPHVRPSDRPSTRGRMKKKDMLHELMSRRTTRSSWQALMDILIEDSPLSSGCSDIKDVKLNLERDGRGSGEVSYSHKAKSAESPQSGIPKISSNHSKTANKSERNPSISALLAKMDMRIKRKLLGTCVTLPTCSSSSAEDETTSDSEDVKDLSQASGFTTETSTSSSSSESATITLKKQMVPPKAGSSSRGCAMIVTPSNRTYPFTPRRETTVKRQATSEASPTSDAETVSTRSADPSKHSSASPSCASRYTEFYHTDVVPSDGVKSGVDKSTSIGTRKTSQQAPDKDLSEIALVDKQPLRIKSPKAKRKCTTVDMQTSIMRRPKRTCVINYEVSKCVGNMSIVYESPWDYSSHSSHSHRSEQASLCVKTQPPVQGQGSFDKSTDTSGTTVDVEALNPAESEPESWKTANDSTAEEDETISKAEAALPTTRADDTMDSTLTEDTANSAAPEDPNSLLTEDSADSLLTGDMTENSLLDGELNSSQISTVADSVTAEVTIVPENKTNEEGHTDLDSLDDFENTTNFRYSTRSASKHNSLNSVVDKGLSKKISEHPAQSSLICAVSDNTTDITLSDSASDPLWTKTSTSQSSDTVEATDTSSTGLDMTDTPTTADETYRMLMDYPDNTSLNDVLAHSSSAEEAPDATTAVHADTAVVEVRRDNGEQSQGTGEVTMAPGHDDMICEERRPSPSPEAGSMENSVQQNGMGKVENSVLQDDVASVGEDVREDLSPSVMYDKILPFVTNINQLFSANAGKKYAQAIDEVLNECYERSSRNDLDNDQERLAWALLGFPPGGAEGVDAGHKIPRFVKKFLDKFAETNADNTSDEEENDSDGDAVKKIGGCIKMVREGKLAISDVCIACDDPSEKPICQHPLFEGGLCHDCKIDFLDNIFTLEHDWTNSFCAVCANGGELFMCDQPSCTKVYCPGCISLMIGEEMVNDMRKVETWTCFLCRPYSSETHGLLQPKANWTQHVLMLFKPEGIIQPPIPELSERRPIRVLSLFDGIGTARLVLENLGVEVGVYYASEIDEDALTVTKVRHPDIQHIGDITKLDADGITALCPIDLVIGGSPCNELSIANPARKGLLGTLHHDLAVEPVVKITCIKRPPTSGDPILQSTLWPLRTAGTGQLFFEFYRVISVLQKGDNHGHHLFWLYENVFPLVNDVRATISRFLECEPSRWDARYFTPQKRSRYFWGNMPGLYMPPESSVEVQRRANKCLDDILMPSRRAVVKQVRTTTTNTNSLTEGKHVRTFPVQMGDRPDTLWSPELERLFGFPDHYTDVGNLSAARRQKLIGKSWSVPVVQHLLRPLCHLFKTKLPTKETPLTTE